MSATHPADAGRSICPHCAGSLVADAPVAIGRIVVDPAGLVTCGGVALPIRGAQRRLLYALARAHPRPLRRDTLLAAMTDREETELGTVGVQICRLRQTLGKIDTGVVIRTIIDVGYVLEVAA